MRMHRAITPAILVLSFTCGGCGDAVLATSGEDVSGTVTAGPGTTSGSNPAPQEFTQVCASHVFVGRVGPGHSCMDHGAFSGLTWAPIPA